MHVHSVAASHGAECWMEGISRGAGSTVIATEAYKQVAARAERHLLCAEVNKKLPGSWLRVKYLRGG